MPERERRARSGSARLRPRARRWLGHPLLFLGALLVPIAACTADTSDASRVDAGDTAAGRDRDMSDVDLRCVLPEAAEVLHEEEGAVLRVWSFAIGAVHTRSVLPSDSAYLAYRAGVRGELVRPELYVPRDITSAEASIWENERRNNELAYGGSVGAIEPVSCLDALLFAEQNARVPQLERSTEFIASVLVAPESGAGRVVVVFGSGPDAFPPRAVYGLDVVDRYRAEGYRYWYLLHNHPLQQDGTAGVPVPSTSDVAFARSLAAERGLEQVRVTNGFVTFHAEVAALAALRAR